MQRRYSPLSKSGLGLYVAQRNSISCWARVFVQNSRIFRTRQSILGRSIEQVARAYSQVDSFPLVQRREAYASVGASYCTPGQESVR